MNSGNFDVESSRAAFQNKVAELQAAIRSRRCARSLSPPQQSMSYQLPSPAATQTPIHSSTAISAMPDWLLSEASAPPAPRHARSPSLCRSHGLELPSTHYNLEQEAVPPTMQKSVEIYFPNPSLRFNFAPVENCAPAHYMAATMPKQHSALPHGSYAYEPEQQQPITKLPPYRSQSQDSVYSNGGSVSIPSTQRSHSSGHSEDVSGDRMRLRTEEEEVTVRAPKIIKAPQLHQPQRHEVPAPQTIQQGHEVPAPQTIQQSSHRSESSSTVINDPKLEAKERRERRRELALKHRALERALMGATGAANTWATSLRGVGKNSAVVQKLANEYVKNSTRRSVSTEKKPSQASDCSTSTRSKSSELRRVVHTITAPLLKRSSSAPVQQTKRSTSPAPSLTRASAPPQKTPTQRKPERSVLQRIDHNTNRQSTKGVESKLTPKNKPKHQTTLRSFSAKRVHFDATENVALNGAHGLEHTLSPGTASGKVNGEIFYRQLQGSPISPSTALLLSSNTQQPTGPWPAVLSPGGVTTRALFAPPKPESVPVPAGRVSAHDLFHQRFSAVLEKLTDATSNSRSPRGAELPMPHHDRAPSPESFASPPPAPVRLCAPRFARGSALMSCPTDNSPYVTPSPSRNTMRVRSVPEKSSPRGLSVSPNRPSVAEPPLDESSVASMIRRIQVMKQFTHGIKTC